MGERISSGFFFHEFAEAVRRHHPEATPGKNPALFALMSVLDGTEEEAPGRFVKPTETVVVGGMARQLSRLGDLTVPGGAPVKWGLGKSYKGLISQKTPFDIVLYTDLIWQVKPRTLIELGSLQGGSGLWFADQCSLLAPECEVHSFDDWADCVSKHASHPRLHFHRLDLSEIERLEPAFAHLPHPWIVADDAHPRPRFLESVKAIGGFMRPGDYYVNENDPTIMSLKHWSALLETFEACGFLVDTRYTNAFGWNATGAPSNWLRKS